MVYFFSTATSPKTQASIRAARCTSSLSHRAPEETCPRKKPTRKSKIVKKKVKLFVLDSSNLSEFKLPQCPQKTFGNVLITTIITIC